MGESKYSGITSSILALLPRSMELSSDGKGENSGRRRFSREHQELNLGYVKYAVYLTSNRDMKNSVVK